MEDNLIRFDWAMKRLLRDKGNYVVQDGYQRSVIKTGWDEGHAEGLAEGMRKGKARGKAEGLAEEKAENVKEVARRMRSLLTSH